MTRIVLHMIVKDVPLTIYLGDGKRDGMPLGRFSITVTQKARGKRRLFISDAWALQPISKQTPS